jgi:ActR/RegA family two-component response regulator
MMQSSIAREVLASVEDRVVAAVVRDVASTETDPERLRMEVLTAVRWLEEAVLRDPASIDLGRLRDLATAAAAASEPVGPLLDRYLSSGWALWEAVAASGPLSQETLVAFGAALLRIGDAAAAAIADAYAATERDLATRSASARREFVDQLLAHRPNDPGLARLVRRAAAYGLGAPTPLRIVVVAAGRELDDDDALVGRIARELGPRASLVATDRGRLLALVRSVVVGEAAIARILAATSGGRWVAASTTPDDIGTIGIAVAEAHAAVDVAVRLGIDGRIVGPEDVLLERALLLDVRMLDAGARAALGPLLDAPRTGGHLVETLRVFLETGGNRRETARRLGLAPRTVAYRIVRAEQLLRGPVLGPGILRLATAIHALDLAAADALARRD